MKTEFKYPSILMVGLGMLLSTRATAQTFTTLHHFVGDDGASPIAGLVLSSNVLYGTTFSGGSSNLGTVFKLNTDGTGFATLYSFTGGSDGGEPYGDLILSGDVLYGTTSQNGSSGLGTVFKFTLDNTNFTTLYSFTAEIYGTNSDGAAPHGVVLSGDTLYGTAVEGGSAGEGTVFKINTDGTGFTNLHNFTATSGNRLTNADGASPACTLLVVGDTLYGTAGSGGSWGYGAGFALNTNGTGFRTLHSFAGPQSDGAYPQAGLIWSGSFLYGPAVDGGPANNGTLFKITTNGTDFANFHSFQYGTDAGAWPWAGLILSNNTLYGAASGGGHAGSGMVFAINTDGTAYTNLYQFTAWGTNASHTAVTNRDGISPQSRLLLCGNTLYGTASAGAIGVKARCSASRCRPLRN